MSAGYPGGWGCGDRGSSLWSVQRWSLASRRRWIPAQLQAPTRRASARPIPRSRRSATTTRVASFGPIGGKCAPGPHRPEASIALRTAAGRAAPVHPSACRGLPERARQARSRQASGPPGRASATATRSTSTTERCSVRPRIPNGHSVAGTLARDVTPIVPCGRRSTPGRRCAPRGPRSASCRGAPRWRRPGIARGTRSTALMTMRRRSPTVPSRAGCSVGDEVSIVRHIPRNKIKNRNRALSPSQTRKTQFFLFTVRGTSCGQQLPGISRD